MKREHADGKRLFARRAAGDHDGLKKPFATKMPQ
jgi:hypothetical protein